MTAQKHSDRKPALIWSVLSNRCPHCRKGKLFLSPNPYAFGNAMKMPDHCPVCGQKYELQTGFYFGTGYVSYGLSVMLLGVIFITWKLAFGLSYKDNSIFECLGAGTAILLLLQPVLQRLARSIWISFFVKYDKDWNTHSGSGEAIS